MSDEFDPYYKWLAIPPEEQPPTHYRLLGLRLFEADHDVIGNAADARMLQIRSYQSGAHANESQRLLKEISAARVCLLRPESRAEYDATLRKKLNVVEPTPNAASPVRPPRPSSGVRVAGNSDEASTTEPMVRVRTTSKAAPPVAVNPPVAADQPLVNENSAPVVVNEPGSAAPAARSPVKRSRRKSSSMIPIVVLSAVVVGLIMLAVILTSSPSSFAIKQIAPVTAYVGEELSVRAELAGAPAGEGDVEWSIKDPPIGAKIDRRQGRLTWKPKFAGTYRVRIIARSGQIEDDEEVQIEVYAARAGSHVADVRIQPIEIQTVEQGQEVSFFVRLENTLSGAEVRYRLASDAPSGAVIVPETGMFSWTPSRDQPLGSQEFTVIAETKGGGAKDQRKLTVSVVKARPQELRSPIIDFITNKTATPGETLRFDIKARDPNHPPRELKYDLDFPPEGAEIDERTGMFTWKLSESLAGRSIRIAVRVSQTKEPRQSTVRVFHVHVKGESPDRGNQADANGVRTLSGHQKVVSSVAVSRQADAVASCAADGTLRIWETASGKVLHESPSNAPATSAIAFSQDGSLIATGATDKLVRVWDRNTGKLQKELKGMEGAVRAIAFSPNNESVAAGSSAAADVQMWDVKSGELQRTFNPGTERDHDFVLSLAFRGDGGRLVAGRLSRTITIWDTQSGREERAAESGLISALAYRPDNRVLVTADLAMKLIFWQIGSADKPVERVLPARPTSLAMSGDGRYVAVVLGTRHIQIWDADQRKLLHELEDAGMVVRDLAFGAQDQEVVLVGSDGKDVRVRTWKFVE